MDVSRTPKTSTIAAFDCFLVLGALGLNLKTATMDSAWGLLAMYVGKPHAYRFSSAGRLGFFVHDIGLNVFFVPIVGTLLVSLVFRRFRVVAAALATLTLIVLYFFQLRAFHEVGQFMSSDLIGDSVHWALANPGSGSDYLTALSTLKLVVLFGLIAGITILAWRSRRLKAQAIFRRAGWYRWLLLAPAITICSIGAVLASIGLAHPQRDSPASKSAIGRMADIMLTRADDEFATSGLSLDQALAASRKMTRTPAFDAGNALVGHEKDADTILFIMETGPARSLDLAREGASLPGTGSLYAHSFVANRHYTTYPYTSDALYSIFASQYPQGRRRLLRDPDVKSINSLMTALRDRDEVRRVYLPSLYRAESDDRMYGELGAERLYVSDAHDDDPLRGVAEVRADALIAEFRKSGSRWNAETAKLLRKRLIGDFQALERMKADIVAASSAGQHYCMTYLPQIAHGPLIPLHSEATTEEREHDLMLLEDLWLKEVVDTVRSVGRLDKTVIVVTADHGIRTREEDPDLVVGTIGDYMFRVPLLIHAPRTLDHTMFIESPSSHIDITPTVLALLDKTNALARMEGVPLWQRDGHDRIYFYARAYGGADGFVDDGTYFMRQAMWDSVYSSRSFSFDAGNLVSEGDPVIDWTTRALDESDRIQETVVTQLMSSTP